MDTNNIKVKTSLDDILLIYQLFIDMGLSVYIINFNVSHYINRMQIDSLYQIFQIMI